MFQLEHCNYAENYRPKLLILRVGVLPRQWNQGFRLWKKCLLSRTLNVYLSRLDRGATYFIWYAVWGVWLIAWASAKILRVCIPNLGRLHSGMLAQNSVCQLALIPIYWIPTYERRC
jgi:hypothetical protein